MTFTVVRSEDPEDYFAPWQIHLDGAVFLDGIELEQEAKSICECLRLAPTRVPHPEKILHLKPPRFTPRPIKKLANGNWRFLGSHPLGGKQRGAVLLELALAVPILLMLLLGSLDLLLALAANGDVHALANAGAACIVTPSCGNAVSFVQGAAAGLSLNASQLTVSQNGNSVTVVYGYQPVGPVFPSVILSATATAP
jgi:TadE-like protein